MINKIIINGRACAGKDTIADYLVKSYGFTKVSFASGIYFIAYEYFGMTTKDRSLLQTIGESMRNIDADVWVKRTFKIAKKIDKCVISDLRKENEYYYAIQNGFTPIRVHADLNIRIERSIKRDGVYPDLSTWENASETGADHLNYKYEIYNNGTFDELYSQIDKFMEV